MSSYATMHPAEDWAETFAHYLHIRDTIDTAAAFGFAPAGVDGGQPDEPATAASPDHRAVDAAGVGAEHGQPLDGAHATCTRSRCPPRVLDKMAFVHRLVTQVRDEVAAAS